MTKPGYHQESVHRVGNVRGARSAGIGVKRSRATNEVGKRAGCIPPPGYTPSYAHVSWVAVVLNSQLRARYCPFSRTHEASRANDSLNRVIRKFSRSGHSKISRPARVAQERPTGSRKGRSDEK